MQEVSKHFWAKCPNTPSNKGNTQKTALCQQDQDWYIRPVSCCVLADNEKLQKILA
ncbi:MAG: hypothetical protein ACUVRV_07545 [Cyanobacteriota bacterium]